MTVHRFPEFTRPLLAAAVLALTHVAFQIVMRWSERTLYARAPLLKDGA
jgi:hypothetical protein